MKYLMLLLLTNCSTKESTLNVESLCKSISTRPITPETLYKLIEIDDVVCFDRKEYIEWSSNCIDHAAFSSSLDYQCFMYTYNIKEKNNEIKKTFTK